MADSPHSFDTDVVVVGSGFGGSVAALRFAEAGQKVVVLERGTWIERDGYHIDLDWFWLPHRNRFGMHDIRKRGRNIMPWLGAGVGGGSHVYAGTLKRCADFAGYPSELADTDMDPYWQRAESMMGVEPYPEHSPYSECRATQVLIGVGENLSEKEPELVEAYGLVPMGVSFAPPEGAKPGDTFVNHHGATQRYFDPGEQSLLGGDIDAKNTLDHNYLHCAQKLGVEIRDLSQATKLEPLDGGGYKLTYTKYVPESRAWARWKRKWFPSWTKSSDETHEIRARRVVLAAGCVGSTELLLQNRQTLPELSEQLGERYTTNGDFLSLFLPFRGIIVAWLAFIALVIGLVIWSIPWIVSGLAVYVAQMLISRKAFEPDIGTTNSDYVQFCGPNREPATAWVETGRYPTPLRLSASITLSLLGLYTPTRYRTIVKLTNLLAFIPPLGLLARTWPIPLLKMGRDKAYGTFVLDESGEAIINYDLDANRDFYRYLDELGKKVAKAARAWWIPNLGFRLFKTMEIPHNQGGVPIGNNASDGVVDHAGRVFGYDDLMVLDGSILRESPGPNPALTILAVCERAMDIAREQLESAGTISAD